MGCILLIGEKTETYGRVRTIWNEVHLYSFVGIVWFFSKPAELSLRNQTLN